MDAATNSRVEIGCTLNVTQDHWDSIFNKGKPKSDTVVIEETEDDNNE